MVNKVDYAVHYYQDGETILFSRRSFLLEVERIKEDLLEMIPGIDIEDMDYYDLFESYYGDVNIEENLVVQ